VSNLRDSRNKKWGFKMEWFKFKTKTTKKMGKLEADLDRLWKKVDRLADELTERTTRLDKGSQFGFDISEQRYVDGAFDRIERKVKAIRASLIVQAHAKGAEYKLLTADADVQDEYTELSGNSIYYAESGDGARVWLKENGYEYVKPIEDLGELWIKEDK